MKSSNWLKTAVTLSGLAVLCFLATGSTDSGSSSSSSDTGSSSSSSSASTSEKVENSAWDGAVPQVVKYLKANLKDPDSAQWIEWSKVEKVSGESYTYRVRCKYRSKNSFGGYVIANQIFCMDADGNVVNVIDLE